MAITQLKQVQVPVTRSKPSSDRDGFSEEHRQYQSILLELCPAAVWPHSSYDASSPRPILVATHHQQQAELFNKALTTAIVDIVDRWTSDDKACFPKRMPLEPHEEAWLKWIDQQVVQGKIGPFSDRLGSWRPDFMVEDYICSDGTIVQENFAITEINARFVFNGAMHLIYGQKAFDVVLDGECNKPKYFQSATDSEIVLGGLFALFNPERPLHLLKGREEGFDIHMFIHAYARRFGSRPHLVVPGDLRVVPDRSHKTGFRLYSLCKNSEQLTDKSQIVVMNGEKLEEVHQIGLELHQDELAALAPEVLRQIALRCFNDLRTILLVHDKRMLGIVKQEIPNLLSRGILDREEAQALDRGVVDTFLAGSPEMKYLIEESQRDASFQKNYILKPIRSGKGDGIVFGEDVSHEEWMRALIQLQSADVINGKTYVVQRRIVPRACDLVLQASGDTVTLPPVGTYHALDGRFAGLGVWRASEGRIVAVSRGGSWLCSVVRQSETVSS